MNDPLDRTAACYHPAWSGNVSSALGKSEEYMRLFLAALVLIAGTMPAEAQWLDRRWPGIPRTVDGNPNLTAPAPRGPDGTPDLTGVWMGYSAGAVRLF